MHNHEANTSLFGLHEIDAQVKTDKVQDVFSSVAMRYDVMNDLMSFGTHRMWKQYFLQLIDYRNLTRIVDLACGSADVLISHAKRVKKAQVTAMKTQGGWYGVSSRTDLIGIDPNPHMLQQARRRLDAKGIFHVDLQQAAAEAIPLADASVDCVTMSFGLRNTTDMLGALAEIFRVLRVGGRMLVLEFSHPTSSVVASAYRMYAQYIPILGEKVTKDKASYQYLIDSIATHPHQHELAKRIEHVGFSSVHWINLCSGLVAIHSGYKA